MTSDQRARLFAFIGVIVFFALVWLYMREFAVFSNTIRVKGLILGSMIAGAVVAGVVLWRWRQRFSPLERHLPEVLLIVIFSVLFAPLFGSLLNRALGTTGNQSFEFVSETPYLASNYGVLKGEKLEPTGYYLMVKENGRELRFKYKAQSYYPLTKPGEMILLPVRTGLFGCRVILLR